MKQLKRLPLFLPLVLLFLLPVCAGRQAPAASAPQEQADEPQRISPEAAYDHVKSGEAILVCAYDDDERCKRIQIDGGITLHQLESQLESLQAKKEIIFYCA